MHCKNLDEMSVLGLKKCVDEEIEELLNLADYMGEKSIKEMLKETYVAISEIKDKWKTMMDKDKKKFMS